MAQSKKKASSSSLQKQEVDRNKERTIQSESPSSGTTKKATAAGSPSDDNILSPPVMNFLGWGGGAFFLIYAGLTAFVAYGAQSVSDALAALAYVCCGILLLPPGRKILEKVTGKSWSQRKLLRAYFLLASAGFVLTFLSMKTNAPEKSASSNPDAKPQNKATYLAAVKENFYWGYIGVDGQYVLKPAYDSATAFCGGVAKVVVGGRWKTIDSEGATTAESVGNCRQAPYSALYPRYDSVSGKYGYRDTNNAWVIAPKFDRAGTFQSTNP